MNRSPYISEAPSVTSIMLKVMLALGHIAHDAVLKARGVKKTAAPFGHGARHDLGGVTLFDSYHCSRYNTNTRRLTEEMFHNVFRDIRELIDAAG
jgi:uracil-DNA glycosylase